MARGADLEAKFRLFALKMENLINSFLKNDKDFPELLVEALKKQNSADFQEEIVRKIFNHEIIKKAPPATIFIKNIHQKIQKNFEDAELVDSLNDFLYSNSVFIPEKNYNLRQKMEDFGHISFKYSSFRGENYLSLRTRLVTFSDLALRLWDAGLVLAEIFAARHDFVSGKTLLELGAGSGISGIAAAMNGAKKCYLTDINDNFILSNIAHNSLINSCGDKIVVEALDWSIATKEDLREICDEPDLIYAADCIYDKDLAAWIVRMIEIIKSLWSSKIMIVVTQRIPETLEFFEAILREKSIKFTIQSPEKLVEAPRETWAQFSIDFYENIRIYNF